MGAATISISLSALLACASWVVAATTAFAQTRTLAEIAAYQGPDRLERLIDGRQEGRPARPLHLARGRGHDAGHRRLHEEIRRRGAGLARQQPAAVLQRVVQERRAGRCAADVVSSGTPALEPLHREQLLQAVRRPPRPS